MDQPDPSGGGTSDRGASIDPARGSPVRTSWLRLLQHTAVAVGLGLGGSYMVQTSEPVVVIIGGCMLFTSPVLLLMPLFMGLPVRGACPACGGAVEAIAASATDLLCRGCDGYWDVGGGLIRPTAPTRVAALPVYAAPTPWEDLTLIVFPTIAFSAQDAISDLLTSKGGSTRVLDPDWPPGCCVCGVPPTRWDTAVRHVSKPGTVQDTTFALVVKDVPYCAEHSGGLSLDRVSSSTPGAEDGFGLKFCSLAYRNAFMAANPWHFTWRDQARAGIPPRPALKAAAPALSQGDPRGRSIALAKQADALKARGDLAGARLHYEQSVAIDLSLFREHPDSAQARRDLAISYTALGDALRAGGDVAGATARYEQSLELRQKQAALAPDSEEAQRDLAVVFERLGTVLRDNGDLVGARARYEQSLSIDERLARANASDTRAQRDLSVSYNKLGDVLCDSGDLAGAAALYLQGLDIRERLAAGDPGKTQAARDVSISLERLAELAVEGGDYDGAVSRYRASDAIARRLAAANPGDPGLQDDARITAGRLAELLAK